MKSRAVWFFINPLTLILGFAAYGFGYAWLTSYEIQEVIRVTYTPENFKGIKEFELVPSDSRAHKTTWTDHTGKVVGMHWSLNLRQRGAPVQFHVTGKNVDCARLNVSMIGERDVRKKAIEGQGCILYM